MLNGHGIRSHFQARRPWRDPLAPMSLIGILEEFDDVGLAPTRFGPSENLMKPLESFTEDDIVETWMRVGGGFVQASDRWRAVVQVFFMKAPNARGVSSLWIQLNADFFDDDQRTGRFIELCRQIYSWGAMDYGLVAYDQEYQEKNAFGPTGPFGGANLARGLPGIYWLNFFGPFYVEWFGEDRFRSLSNVSKDQLRDGGWLIMARDEPLDYTSKEARRKEVTIMEHLGREAFFDMSKPKKKLKIPELWEK